MTEHLNLRVCYKYFKDLKRMNVKAKFHLVRVTVSQYIGLSDEDEEDESSEESGEQEEEPIVDDMDTDQRLPTLRNRPVNGRINAISAIFVTVAAPFFKWAWECCLKPRAADQRQRTNLGYTLKPAWQWLQAHTLQSTYEIPSSPPGTDSWIDNIRAARKPPAVSWTKEQSDMAPKIALNHSRKGGPSYTD
ncbi:MAG: hypothetical protein Q9218_001766 [Villophora microphyllina]